MRIARIISTVLLLLLLLPAMVVPQDLLGAGKKSFAKGDYVAAVKLFQQACQSRPDDLAASYYWGRAAFETADYEAAIVAFERILLWMPEAAGVKLALARVHARLGSQKIAWAYFKSLQIPDLPSSVKRQVQQYTESKGQGKLLESLLAAAASHEEQTRPFAEVVKDVPLAPAAGTKVDKGSVGFIAVVRGKVKANHAQRGERVLKVKSEVFLDDTITTAKGEGVQIVFNDNTVIRLGANSTLAIDTYLWDANKNAGAMKATVKEGVFSVMGGLITKGSPDRFTLETPAATIGVRGSGFTGSYSDGQFNVVFVAGTGIYVAQGGEMTDITQPGYGVEGVFGGAFSAPAELDAEVINDLMEGLSQPVEEEPEEQEFDTIHQRAYACFGDFNIAFTDDPSSCEAVCSVCHKSDVKEDKDIILIYTLTFCDAEPKFTPTDLTISGGTLVAGSLTQVDATHWTFQVKLTGSTAELAVAVNEAKCVVNVTRKGATDKIVVGQTQNPELLWADMVYPGHYPGKPFLSSSNTYEQNWEALPEHHKVCSECHPDQSIDAHNHPIFVNMALDFGNGLVEEMGLILCASCHDPHSNQSALLRMGNDSSNLCQYCHGK